MTIIRITNKFKKLFSSRQRMRIIELVILMFIGGILETCSVGLIIPFMDAIVNIDSIMDLWYVQIVCRVLDLNYPFTFLFVASTSLGILFILKNAYLIFEYSVQYRFSYNNMFMTQKRVLSAFLNKPYEFFLGIKSGELIRIVNNDVPAAYALLIQLLGLFTELVVSLMLVVTIFVMIPYVSIAISIILALLLFFTNKVIRPILRKEGNNSQKATADLNRWLIQSVNGIKEIKVMNTEGFFISNFERSGKMMVKSQRANNTLSMVPRFVIEAICMAVLFFVIAILIITGSRFNEIMPILSAVAMAAVRLLPSVNRISTAMAVISYNEPMLDKTIDSLDIAYRDGDKTMDNDNHLNDFRSKDIAPIKEKLCISNVTFHYPNSEVEVLQDASLTIHKGESVGIIGPSGAGKTTTVDIILGLISPQKGMVIVDGIDVSSNIKSWHSQIGYIPQSIFMMDGSIRDNVVFGREMIPDDDLVWDCLKNAALDEYVRSLPLKLDTQIGERGVRLSGGQRQRIGIARALYKSPDILIFDEATSALDKETEEEVMKAVEGLQRNKTQIIIAHRMSTIKNCDSVYRVDNGKIIKEK